MNATHTTESPTWAHRPLRELLNLSWPITLSMVSYSAMTLVDTLLVARLGPAALAGVGFGGIACFVLCCFPMGLLRGAKTLVAQAVGARRHEDVAGHLAAAVVSAVVIGLVASGLAQLLGMLLEALAATPEAGAAARTYHGIRMLSAPVVLAFVALREVRYALGDGKSAMWATLAANAVNIALAYLFVYELELGVAGAAWATVIAHCVECVCQLLLAHTAGVRRALASLRRSHFVELWRIGMPTGVQFTLEVGSFATLSAMLASLSEMEMAAHQIAIQVIHFSFLPAVSVGEAASVLAGQAVGAGRDELVRRVARLALATTSVYTGLCTLVLAFGAAAIARGFTDDPALAEVATRLLWLAAVFQIADGGNIIARGVLRGVGDVRMPAVVGIVCAWMLTPPLTWLLGWQAGLGAFGGWLGLTAEILVATAVLWLRFERNHWHPAAAASRARLAAAAAPVVLDPPEAPLKAA